MPLSDEQYRDLLQSLRRSLRRDCGRADSIANKGIGVFDPVVATR